MVDFKFHFSMLKANQIFFRKSAIYGYSLCDYITENQQTPNHSHKNDNKICVFE